ncbi:hypothetical protein JHK82_036218 [Glycine max]|nr:hypothetical protein JHK85_036951 [Glycine max]KAG4976933.1 hypothetical protein JHK86_036407 [Glycine max]KAG5112949.1 hypothetical protein JHK82_036218 [Glycine max]
MTPHTPFAKAITFVMGSTNGIQGARHTKDHLGQWLEGFAGYCGFTTNLNAELLAIYNGLRIAKERGFVSIICESDSKVALDLIKDGVPIVHPYASLIA